MKEGKSRMEQVGGTKNTPSGKKERRARRKPGVSCNWKKVSLSVREKSTQLYKLPEKPTQA